MAVGLTGLGAVLALGAILPVGPTPFDAALQPMVSAAYPALASGFFDGLASLPVVAVLLAMVGTWSWARGERGLAVTAIVGALAEIPTELVKLIVDRPRPPGAAIEAIGSAASYPSGHTVRAVVVTGLLVLAFLGKRNRDAFVARTVGMLAVAVVVALVGLARIASGDHWPTDVIGGAILGAAWLALAATIAPALVRRRRAPTATERTLSN